MGAREEWYVEMEAKKRGRLLGLPHKSDVGSAAAAGGGGAIGAGGCGDGRNGTGDSRKNSPKRKNRSRCRKTCIVDMMCDDRVSGIHPVLRTFCSGESLPQIDEQLGLFVFKEMYHTLACSDLIRVRFSWRPEFDNKLTQCHTLSAIIII